jgi:hypothetical protein
MRRQWGAEMETFFVWFFGAICGVGAGFIVAGLMDAASDADDDAETMWLTYAEAAGRIGTTSEAVRQRAIRGKWPRIRGRDGKARVMIRYRQTDEAERLEQILRREP